MQIALNFLFLFSFYLFPPKILCDSTCYDAKQEGLEHHLATKTPYRVIANVNDKKIEFDQCSPIRMWGIFRHGTRNPSKKQIRRMKTILSEHRDAILAKGALCERDKEQFRTWKVHLNEDEEKFLVPEGEVELIELAERTQNRFPDLLFDQYDNLTYKFKYTHTQRAKKSAEGFATGLFGRDNIRQVWYPEPESRDPILRFYKRCPRWKVEVDKNPDAMEQVRLFISSEIFRAFLEGLRVKTGILDLSAEDARLMYTTCAFETAWDRHRISPWCSLFTRKSIKIMEFLEDLEYYWIDGYGYELTYKQACPAAQNMFEHLNPNAKTSQYYVILYPFRKKQIRRMKTTLSEHRDAILAKGALCERDKEQFRTWKVHLNEDEEKFLVPEGELELIELAERTQNRFPDLLFDQYDNLTYKFKYTHTQRAKKSAEGFATGLFGRDNIRQVWYPEPESRDPILRFYKRCPRWKVEVDKNPDAMEQVRLFISSEIFRAFLEGLRMKTGILDLTAEDARLMYTTCAFETAWDRHRISPWCSLFTRKSIKIMEFLEDLEYYWIDGYGYELTYKQACPAAQNMFEHLNPNAKHPNITLYFTHSGTLLKYLAFLNLYRDQQPLLHTTFGGNYSWRSSLIDTFASNILFVTFSCPSGAKVLTMHQERVVTVPGCPLDSPLCDYAQFEEIFQQRINECNFEQMCTIS
uniref:Putative conserved secreted protein n=1 Tax=Lutzomyia longipalpis TaxID=7200 RepID=A0A7G3AGA7_LUTLO